MPTCVGSTTLLAAVARRGDFALAAREGVRRLAAGQPVLALLAWSRGTLAAGSQGSMGIAAHGAIALEADSSGGGEGQRAEGDVVLGGPWGEGAEYDAAVWNTGLLAGQVGKLIRRMSDEAGQMLGSDAAGPPSTPLLRSLAKGGHWLAMLWRGLGLDLAAARVPGLPGSHVGTALGLREGASSPEPMPVRLVCGRLHCEVPALPPPSSDRVVGALYESSELLNVAGQQRQGAGQALAVHLAALVGMDSATVREAGAGVGQERDPLDDLHLLLLWGVAGAEAAEFAIHEARGGEGGHAFPLHEVLVIAAESAESKALLALSQAAGAGSGSSGSGQASGADGLPN